MMPSSDPLPAGFAAALAAAAPRLSPLGDRVIFFHTIGSTNDVALALAVGGDSDGAIVIADGQTAGRGRLGRRWFSPPGSGLYVSTVLQPSAAQADPQRATGLLTLAAGLALAEAIESVTGLRVDIKWPNDLMIARRKLGGILAEAVGVERRPMAQQRAITRVVLGYGINIRSTAYPQELADRATSLEAAIGRPMDRANLCAETLAALSRRYRDLLAGRFDAILDGWRSRAPGSCGAPVTWSTPTGAGGGVTAGVGGRGALVVRVGDHLETIVGGEVTWL
jgi:BirA family transcriptional regulator, biotin operon repressor / biotin---[acetyl-CoA-carboxylase] ligase